jgi:polysaccharide pyruvyl transferase WcaK-like protein
VQSLAASQVLICLAGVSFVSGRTKFLPFNIATIWPAMVLGVPVAKYAQAMGPFNERLNRLAARCFLANCHKVFARGEQTHRFMLDFFGPAEFFARADDAAFLFQKEYCLSHEVVDIRSGLDALDSRKQSGQSIVGVCPSIVVAKRAQAAGWNYADRMRQLVEQLVEAGHTVALFPNATRGEDMDKTHNNDLPLLDEIVSGLSDLIREGMVVFGGSLNVAQIHRVIERCDVVAVSRFHAMVGALAARVPVLVIGWSHKYLEVMERFSQADMVLDYQKGEAEPILDRIYMLLHERSVRATQIKAAMPAVQKLAKMQVDFVVNLLEGPQ